MSDMKVVEINEQTKLPLGLVTGLICSLAGGIFWLTMLYADIASAKRDIVDMRSDLQVVHEINNRLAKIEGQMDLLVEEKKSKK